MAGGTEYVKFFQRRAFHLLSFLLLWGEKKLQTCAQLVDVESLCLVQWQLTCLQHTLYDEAKWCPDIPGHSDLLAI